MTQNTSPALPGRAEHALTYDQAAVMLPDGECIHTFVNPAGILVGADWDRDDVLALLRTGRPELSGDMATEMGHGLMAYRGSAPVFIATRPADAPSTSPVARPLSVTEEEAGPLAALADSVPVAAARDILARIDAICERPEIGLDEDSRPLSSALRAVLAEIDRVAGR